MPNISSSPQCSDSLFDLDIAELGLDANFIASADDSTHADTPSHSEAQLTSQTELKLLDTTDTMIDQNKTVNDNEIIKHSSTKSTLEVPLHKSIDTKPSNAKKCQICSF